jgi:CRISPR-associated endonuclease Csn1
LLNNYNIRGYIMKLKHYNLGLDIGTSSVGFAATDDNNDLIRVKGHNVIGVRLFTEGQTAEERRMARTGRRRYNRRKWRLGLLNDIFADEINRVDSEFFNRLKASSISSKDNQKQYFGSLLFPEIGDSNFYHNGNPTIYHLRNRLVHQHKKADIREIYLAFHHMVKYRGNFLDDTPVSSFDSANLGLADQVDTINSLYEELGINFQISDSYLTKIESILLDNQKKKATKKEEILALFYDEFADDTLTKKEVKAVNTVRKQIATEILNAILGYKINVLHLLQYEMADGSKVSLDFSSANSEDDFQELITTLDDKQSQILSTCKLLYSRVRLNQIIPSGLSLSESMIAKYDQHHAQLQQLKKLMDTILTTNQSNALKITYSTYIGNRDKQNFTKTQLATLDEFAVDGKTKAALKNVKNVLDYKKSVITLDDFYLVLQAILASFADNEDVKAILQQMDSRKYLLKQRNNQNGNIPHQLHQKEMEAIIEQQSQYYPFLAELNPNPKRKYIAKYKLSELIAFRVPYYVGPLITEEEQQKTSGKTFAWMQRKAPGAITPWNFDDKVDREATATQFIKRLTVKDTYLLNEDVLPDNSLIYQQFKVLNELNMVKINGKRLSTPEKQGAFNDLFKNQKRVSTRRFKNYLVGHYHYLNTMDITGLSDPQHFNNGLGSYNDLHRILGDKVDNSQLQNDLEKIIEWSTVFEDRDIMATKLKTIAWLTEDERKALVNKRYSGWGRLSKRLLTTIVNEDGESILQAMWNTSITFMEVVSQPQIKQQLQMINNNFVKDMGMESILDDAYTSPQNKKAIRQTYRLVKDIQKAMGGQAPDKISIEFTRNPQDKGEMTKKRHVSLERQYKSIGKEITKELKEELKQHKNNMNNDKIFLYFMQLGKDLYTGEPINIDNLDAYQIDHIIPQSYYKDNALDNRVLTHTKNNQAKKDETPLNGLSSAKQQIPLWKKLFDLGLMSKQKLSRLLMTDINGISKYTKHGFIKRQLVETSQVIKLVANILGDEYRDDDTKVIEVKAKMNSQMRENFALYKVRSVNDYHHAMDAYLTTVVGNYLYNRYPKLRSFFVYDEFQKFSLETDLKQIKTFNFLRDITSGKEEKIYDSKSGEIILDRKHLIDNLKKIYNYKLMLVTKELTTKNGQLYNQTIQSAKLVKDSFIPIKKGYEVAIYGGHTGNVDHHMVIVRYRKGKDTTDKYKVIGIPLRYLQVLRDAKKVDANHYSQVLNQIVQMKLGTRITDFKVVLDNIMYGQLIRDGQTRFTLGSSAYKYNATQMVLNEASMKALSDKNAWAQWDDAEINQQFMQVYQNILDCINRYFSLYDANQFRKKLNDGIDAFSALDNFGNAKHSGKYEVLIKVLEGLHANASVSDVKELHLSTPLGKMQSKSGIELSPEAYVYYQSPSGLFTRKVQLKTL